MPANMDVLLVDDRPEAVRFLSEFLQGRCRRVDTAAGAQDALERIDRRRASGQGYHMIFCDQEMPGFSGLDLLAALRKRREDAMFVLMAGRRSQELEAEAQRLGAVAVLDKPADLRRVEDLMVHTTTVVRRRAAAEDQNLFFGTGRLQRQPQTQQSPRTPPELPALEPRVPGSPPQTTSYQAPAMDEPGAALERLRPQPLPPQAPIAPVIAGYQRRPSGIISVATGSSRTRRSVDAMPPPATGRTGQVRSPLPAPQPTTGTTRIRRGVEGSAGIARPHLTPSAGRDYACIACGKTFLVVVRPEGYATVCVHCGALQRIEP